MESIKEVLMRRDGLEDYEADELIQEAIDELEDMLNRGEDYWDDICEVYFGLEPDYLWEIMPI